MFTLSEEQYKDALERSEKRRADYRDRHARTLVTLGMVIRTASGFRVREISEKMRQPAYDVWRDSERIIRCRCEDYEAQAKMWPRYRCAHILAVKYYFETTAAQSSQVTAQVIPFRQAKQEKQGKRKRRRPRPPINPEHLAAFCTWNAVANTLDAITPRWSYEVLLVAPARPNRVKVVAAITIGNITRLGTGWGAQSPLGLKHAEDEALKMAATRFRPIRLALIEQGGDDPPPTSNTNRAAQPERKRLRGSPEAKSITTLITPKQLSTIRTLESKLNLARDEASRTLYDCPTENLAKRFASALILHLEDELDAQDNYQYEEAFAS